MKTVSITEMFNSISGEVSLAARQGTPTSFIRFQGCNLRCDYCDASKTWQYSILNIQNLDDVCAWILDQPCKHVLFTGGEPLLQQESILHIITRMGYEARHKLVTIETNGTIFPSSELLQNVDCWVVDYKLNYKDRMLDLRMFRQFPRSIIKFVINNKKQAIETLNVINLISKIRGPKQEYAISIIQPHSNNFDEKQLFELIMKYGRNVIINTQIHKYLNFS